MPVCSSSFCENNKTACISVDTVNHKQLLVILTFQNRQKRIIQRIASSWNCTDPRLLVNNKYRITFCCLYCRIDPRTQAVPMAYGILKSRVAELLDIPEVSAQRHLYQREFLILSLPRKHQSSRSSRFQVLHLPQQE